MKHKYFFIAGLCAFSIITADIIANSFKKVDSKGIANMIFASSAIGKGKESSAALKDSFTSKDKIFARCYMPKAIGGFSKGEECHLHLWVNGKVVWRGGYSGKFLPESSWDQIQIYIRNTGDDEFNGKISNTLDGLSSGVHSVQFVFLRDKFMKYKLVKKGNQVTKEAVYAPVYLSKGTFSYTVE